jgi:putative transcriptional regulator
MAILRNKVIGERVTRGLTQSELAGKVNVTRQTIAAIEKGSYSPSAVLAFQLALVLETPVNELFWLEEEL